MVVYADAIWLLNFCIDCLLLMLTAVVLKKRVKKRRLLLGACIASTIVIFAFTPYAATMTNPLMKLLYSVLIVYAAFGFTRIRTFVQTLLMFYFVTFMVGGGLIGLHFFMQSNQLTGGVLSTRSLSFGDPISWTLVVFGFPLMYYFSKKRISEIEVTEIRYDQIVKVEIAINGAALQLSGLIDSGNQLYDPLTKTPVMILEAACATEFFPEWLLQQTRLKNALPEWDEKEPEWATRLRIVPYRVVGQNHGFLLAVKPDEVRIYKGDELLRVTRILIGLSDTKLSSDHEYSCILHPKMFVSADIVSA